MRRTQLIGIGRAFAFYGAGLIAGVQGALYIFDLSDDGIADWRSGMIALVFLAFGLGFVLKSFWSR